MLCQALKKKGGGGGVEVFRHMFYPLPILKTVVPKIYHNGVGVLLSSTHMLL